MTDPYLGLGLGMSNFDVDANPKISISIPVDLPKRSDAMAQILVFRDFDALSQKKFSACGGLRGRCAAGRGEGGIILMCELS